MTQQPMTAPPPAVELEHLPFTMDAGIAARAAIGVIVLATDNTLEHEFRQLLALDGVAFYETRIPNAVSITPATLAEMEGRMTEAAAVILPGVPLDVVAYGCTSGALVIGEERVFARIHEARPGVACTTPITAAKAALAALGARRIALLTPYVADINRALKAHFEDHGVAVPAMGSFNHENDNEVARIDRASVSDAVRRLVDAADVDAVFVSCTSVRVVDFVTSLEAEVGVPVTSSNHALAWHCLRLAGVADRRPEAGRLFAV